MVRSSECFFERMEGEVERGGDGGGRDDGEAGLGIAGRGWSAVQVWWHCVPHWRCLRLVRCPWYQVLRCGRVLTLVQLAHLLAYPIVSLNSTHRHRRS